MALRLKAVRVYTHDLGTQLYVFPEISDATSADAATPSGPYGPDLVEVRLGMSFEEAEKAIRNHMKVGRVLQGRRAFDPAGGDERPDETARFGRTVHFCGRQRHHPQFWTNHPR